MSRQELREQERRKKKLQLWLKSFNADQKILWESTILSGIEKNDRITAAILDDCFMAAVINNTDLKLLDIRKIIAEANEYIEYTKNFIDEKGSLEVIKDENLRTKIRKEAKKMLAEGQVMSSGVNELKKVHKVPVKDLTIIWAEAKEELKEEKNEALDNIGEMPTDEAINRIKKNIAESINEKELPHISDIVVIGKESLKFEIPTTLKIIEQTIKLQGTYGTYIKTIEGVKTEQIFVKDKEDLKEYKKTVEREYNKGKEELNKKMEEIKEEISKLDKRASKNFGIITEIEEVFAI